MPAANLITADSIEVLRLFKAQSKKAPLSTRDVGKLLKKSAAGIIKQCERKELLIQSFVDGKTVNRQITPKGRKVIAAWDLLYA